MKKCYLTLAKLWTHVEKGVFFFTMIFFFFFFLGLGVILQRNANFYLKFFANLR